MTAKNLQDNYASPVGNWNTDKAYTIALKTLSFFKDELKNARNYGSEMEKLMVLSLLARNKTLYTGVRNFMTKDNGDYDDVAFRSYEYQEAARQNQDFINEMRIEEIEGMKQKLNENIISKGLKVKASKI